MKTAHLSALTALSLTICSGWLSQSFADSFPEHAGDPLTVSDWVDVCETSESAFDETVIASEDYLKYAVGLGHCYGVIAGIVSFLYSPRHNPAVTSVPDTTNTEQTGFCYPRVGGATDDLFYAFPTLKDIRSELRSESTKSSWSAINAIAKFIQDEFACGDSGELYYWLPMAEIYDSCDFAADPFLTNPDYYDENGILDKKVIRYKNRSTEYYEVYSSGYCEGLLYAWIRSSVEINAVGSPQPDKYCIPDWITLAQLRTQIAAELIRWWAKDTLPARDSANMFLHDLIQDVFPCDQAG